MISQVGQRLLGYGFDRLYVTGRRYTVYDQTRYLESHSTPDDRATGFDWALYQVMASDRARLHAYRRDIATLVTGKTVLEIGPGPHAFLTLLAAESGATSILSIEANDWAAAEARRRLRPFADRVRVVAGHTGEVSDATMGEVRHFDVLLHECFHSVASQEQVIESIAGLRRRGFTFDTVISKGFTTYVAPATGPSSAPMSVAERVLMGWPPGRRAADAAMAVRRSTLHGDLPRIAAQRLAPVQKWQWCDFEADACTGTAGTLRFAVDHLERAAGLQFFNQFAFHHGDLDTGETATHWGVYFVPLPLDGAPAGCHGAGELVLTTRQPDPLQPSVVDLAVELAGVRSPAVRL